MEKKKYSKGREKLTEDIIEGYNNRDGDISFNEFDFNDKGILGYSWVQKLADFNKKKLKQESNK